MAPEQELEQIDLLLGKIYQPRLDGTSRLDDIRAAIDEVQYGRNLHDVVRKLRESNLQMSWQLNPDGMGR